MWLHNKLASLYPTIRRREATDCDGPGLGYHSKLGAPSCWTPVPGKTCPGRPVRVDQWRRIVLPAFLDPFQPGPAKETNMFVLRCDQTPTSPGRPIALVNAQRHRLISNAERAELVH